MMTQPERSPERDAAIEAMLPFVPISGWTVRTLTDAAGPDADLLFPGGAADMVETYLDLADRKMEAEAGDLSALRMPDRIKRLIAVRFEQNRPHKDAVRRAFGVLALPTNAGLAAKTAARTVDAMWHAAGDASADFSWYTKRLTLLGIYGATLLYWLRDDSLDDERTLAFLDRRLKRVAMMGRLRRKLSPKRRNAPKAA